MQMFTCVKLNTRRLFKIFKAGDSDFSNTWHMRLMFPMSVWEKVNTTLSLDITQKKKNPYCNSALSQVVQLLSPPSFKEWLCSLANSTHSPHIIIWYCHSERAAAVSTTLDPFITRWLRCINTMEKVRYSLSDDNQFFSHLVPTRWNG